MLLFSPIIYIGMFNAFFGANVAWTFENWLVMVVLQIIAAIMFLVLLIVAIIGVLAAKSGWLIIIVAIILVLALPAIVIFAFNLTFHASVPINIWTYLLVVLTFIVNSILGYVFKGRTG